MPGTPSVSRTRTRTLTLFAVTLALLAGLGWLTLRGKGRTSGFSGFGADEPSQASKPFDPSVWAWRNEEHWVVDQTARDIGEMLCVAGGEKPETYHFTASPDPRTPHAYLLRAEGPKFKDPLQVSFQIHTWTWDPEDFRGWTHAVAEGLVVKPGPADLHLSTAVADQLLRPDDVTVSDASRRVSAALNRQPASADVHDAAGAVLTAFGLFDDPGVFVDHRHVLCRLSAHAALAAELRTSPPGPSEALSRLGLLALTSRTKSCLEAIADLRRDHPGSLSPAWLNAMGMLVTKDWRGATDPRKVTDAERLASFAGRCEGLSAQQAMDWVKPAEAAAPHAFLYHEAGNWDVEVGLRREAAFEAYRLDMGLIQTLRSQWQPGKEENAKALVAALNVHAGRCYDPVTRQLQVLGWGDWAQRFQADLLDDMMRSIDYYANFFGSKEDTAAYLVRIERTFGDLEQFPVLQKRYANLKPSTYPAAILRVEQLLRTHPEVVADGNFPCLSEPTPGGAPHRSMATYQQWESLPLPFGTAYNAFKRCDEMPEWSSLSLDDCKAIRAIDPCSFWLRRCVLTKEAGRAKPTPESVEALYGPSKDFAPNLYFDWMDEAYPKDSLDRIPLLQQKAQWDPWAYFTLSDLYRHLHRDPEALQAALKGYDLDMEKEPVTVSNSMLWAVRYLYRTGQQGRAQSIAEACGDVGSATGLRTEAVLRELHGRYRDAEDLYDQIRDRYQDDESGVFGFYVRTAQRDPRMKAKLAAAVRDLFPAGLVAWNAADETGPPAAGVRLESTPPWAQEAGLRPRAVIVAFDGMKVENIRQYEAVRAIQLDDQFTVTAYQDGKYQTLSLEAPNRLFGVELLEYRR